MTQMKNKIKKIVKRYPLSITSTHYDINTIRLSKYCVGHYPKIARATYTYKGNSLCGDCMKLEYKHQGGKEIRNRFKEKGLDI